MQSFPLKIRGRGRTGHSSAGYEPVRICISCLQKLQTSSVSEGCQLCPSLVEFPDHWQEAVKPPDVIVMYRKMFTFHLYFVFFFFCHLCGTLTVCALVICVLLSFPRRWSLNLWQPPHMTACLNQQVTRWKVTSTAALSIWPPRWLVSSRFFWYHSDPEKSVFHRRAVCAPLEAEQLIVPASRHDEAL